MKEISNENGFYRISGSLSKLITSEHGDPFYALIEEYVTIYSSIYQDLDDIMKSDKSRDYYEGKGDLVARLSRIGELHFKDDVQTLVKETNSKRILEIGCGSGVYMKYTAEANPELTGGGD